MNVENVRNQTPAEFPYEGLRVTHLRRLQSTRDMLGSNCVANRRNMCVPNNCTPNLGLTYNEFKCTYIHGMQKYSQVHCTGYYLALICWC